MLIEFCKSKITYATITQAELHYEGSITVDHDILKAAETAWRNNIMRKWIIRNMNTQSRFCIR